MLMPLPAQHCDGRSPSSIQHINDCTALFCVNLRPCAVLSKHMCPSFQTPRTHQSCLPCLYPLLPPPQGSRLSLHPGDAQEPDIADTRLLPDTEALADRPKPCLQEVGGAQAAARKTNSCMQAGGGLFTRCTHVQHSAHWVLRTFEEAVADRSKPCLQEVRGPQAAACRPTSRLWMRAD